MRVILEFEIGDRTCASKPGKIECPFLGTRSFGQNFVCLRFNEDLHESSPGGSLLRCLSCLEEFGEPNDCPGDGNCLALNNLNSAQRDYLESESELPYVKWLEQQGWRKG